MDLGGAAALEGAQDLDALDRVDAEVGLDVEIQPEHFGGVAGALADDRDQTLLHVGVRRRGGGAGGRHGLRRRFGRDRCRGMRRDRLGLRGAEDRGDGPLVRPGAGGNASPLEIRLHDRFLCVQEAAHQLLELQHHLRNRVLAGDALRGRGGRGCGQVGRISVRPRRLGIARRQADGCRPSLRLAEGPGRGAVDQPGRR